MCASGRAPTARPSATSTALSTVRVVHLCVGCAVLLTQRNEILRFVHFIKHSDIKPATSAFLLFLWLYPNIPLRDALLGERLQLELGLSVVDMEAREMIRALRALAVLLQNQSSVPRIQARQLTATSKSSSRGSHASGFFQHTHVHIPTHPHAYI